MRSFGIQQRTFAAEAFFEGKVARTAPLLYPDFLTRVWRNSLHVLPAWRAHNRIYSVTLDPDSKYRTAMRTATPFVT